MRADCHGTCVRGKGAMQRLSRILLRWGIIVVALLITMIIVPGIRVGEPGDWFAVFIMAAVLGLINTFVRPILRMLSCGMILLTMGLFLFVINAFTLMLASFICTNYLGVQFYVDGFGAALVGSIIISIVSFLLALLIPDDVAKSRLA
jgi:putative membrane protein